MKKATFLGAVALACAACVSPEAGETKAGVSKNPAALFVFFGEVRKIDVSFPGIPAAQVGEKGEYRLFSPSVEVEIKPTGEATQPSTGPTVTPTVNAEGLKIPGVGQ